MMSKPVQDYVSERLGVLGGIEFVLLRIVDAPGNGVR